MPDIDALAERAWWAYLKASTLDDYQRDVHWADLTPRAQQAWREAVHAVLGPESRREAPNPADSLRMRSEFVDQGLTPGEFARIADADPRKIRRMLQGKEPVPRWVFALLGILQRISSDDTVERLTRLWLQQHGFVYTGEEPLHLGHKNPRVVDAWCDVERILDEVVDIAFEGVLSGVKPE